MQWLRDRWYAYVPTGIALAGGLSPMAFTLVVIMLPLDPLSKMDLIDRVLPVMIWVTACAGIFFFTWLGWAVPWLDAANQRLQFKRSPSQWWRGIRLAIWSPSLLIAVLGFTIGLALPAYDWLSTGNWLWEMQQAWGIAGMGLAGILAAWSYWFEGKVQQRFLRTLSERRLCFTCNYDLRGNPDAAHCPECGTLLPVAGEADTA